MKNNITNSLGALLLLLVSFMTSSCDKAYLKIAAEGANKQCPMKLDDGMGSITSILYEDNALIYCWDIEKSDISMEQIKVMPNTMKASIASELSSDSETLELLKKIINEDAKIIYRVSDGKSSSDLTMNATELQTMIDKSKENVASQYPANNENVPFAIAADMKEIVNLSNVNLKESDQNIKCSLEGKKLVFSYPVEETELTINAISSDVEKIKDNVKEEIKPNVDPLYETCAIQGYSFVTRYYSKSGEKCDITITPEEIKECLGFK